MMRTGHSRKSVKKSPQIPYSRKPDDLSFEEWQIGLRRQFALTQKFKIKNIGDHPVYSDFEVTNTVNGRPYKVALRSRAIGLNFCNCPDFCVNSLGTCKHIEGVLHRLQRNGKYRKMFETGYVRPYSSITLRYGAEMNRFMKTVEEMTRDPQPLSAIAEAPLEPVEEPVVREDSSDEYVIPASNLNGISTPTKGPAHGTAGEFGKDSMEDLLETGIAFMGKLRNIFSEPGRVHRLIDSWVEKDSGTGKTYLKIPVEKEETLTKTANALGELLRLFVK